MSLKIPRSGEGLLTALSMIWPATVPPLENYKPGCKAELFDLSVPDLPQSGGVSGGFDDEIMVDMIVSRLLPQLPVLTIVIAPFLN